MEWIQFYILIGVWFIVLPVSFHFYKKQIENRWVDAIVDVSDEIGIDSIPFMAGVFTRYIGGDYKEKIHAANSMVEETKETIDKMGLESTKIRFEKNKDRSITCNVEVDVK